MSEDLEQTPQPIEAIRWEKNTRLMRLGVALATALMLLYNVLLFLPTKRQNDGQLSTLITFVVAILLVMVLVFLCIRNYSRGLSRFATLFERG
ncbi:MAG: hypothetical protein HUK17_02665, partial [Bacteroidales bacterium]|nr:hypothetical protein [Bacteroidales bacterium]